MPESVYFRIAKELTKGMNKGLRAVGKDADTFDKDFLRSLKHNAHVFSGAKTFQEVRLMSDFIADNQGRRVPFKEYEAKAREIFDDFNETYLKTEIFQAENSATMASKWQDIEEDKDVLPMLTYSTVGDERVRESHRPLDGVTRPVDDPFWDTYYPPNGWRCRCDVDQEDEEATPTGLGDFKKPEVPPSMQMNVGKKKVLFSPKHPYFIVEDQFKELKDKNFGLPIPKEAQILEPKNLDTIVNSAKSKLKKVKTVQQREDFIFKELDKTRAELDNIWNEEEAVLGYVDEKAMLRINTRQKKLKLKETNLIDGLVTAKNEMEEEIFNILKQEKSANFKDIKGDISKLSTNKIDRGIKYFKGIVGDKKKIQGKKILTLQTEDPIGGRAFFGKKYLNKNEIVGSINLSAKDGIETITHELGHWLEDSDSVYFEKIKGFYAKRTKNQPFSQLKLLKPNSAYRPSEKTIEDDFLNPYTGKFYGKKSGNKIIRQDATEITSMWFTEVFNNPIEFIEKDEEMFSFVYKLLLEN